jgi:hypothetical protein
MVADAHRLRPESRERDRVDYKVEFQYKPQGHARPYVEVQEDSIHFHRGEFVPIPAVGDSVSYLEGDYMVARKVLTRHFSYGSDWCVVNIVVTDMPDEEMAARLKE